MSFPLGDPNPQGNHEVWHDVVPASSLKLEGKHPAYVIESVRTAGPSLTASVLAPTSQNSGGNPGCRQATQAFSQNAREQKGGLGIAGRDRANTADR